MLISTFVEIKPNPKTRNHYLSLGYNLSSGDFLVKVTDLTRSSRSIVRVECDYCYCIKEVTYKEFIRNTSFNNKFSCGNRCGCLKKKELSVIKNGIDSPSKLDSIKDKTRKTNLEKYGVDQYMKTDDFKRKSEKSKIDKYGTSNVMLLDFIKDKVRKTNLEKYGVENPFQSEDIKNKIKSNNLEKYKFEYYSSTDEFKEKFKKTHLERYGVDHPAKSSVIMDRIKDTNFRKYGSEFYMSTVEFKNKSEKTNLERYGGLYSQSEKIRIEKNINCKDPNYIRYIGGFNSVYNCDFGHTFSVSSSTYLSRQKNDSQICIICNPIGSRSGKESELYEFIKSIYTKEIIQSYRDKLEIDIYLPDLKIGFEFNGLYYHSEEYKERNYHLDKTNYFKEREIRIIHIWEDDWIYKKEIIKSQIRNLVGLSNRVGARKCEIKEIFDTSLIRKFLNENHIQGWCWSPVNIGIFNEGILIGLMCFNRLEGRKRLIDGDWCLSRYCNYLNYSIIGGASKAFSYFIKKYNPSRIISYSDRSWSVGTLYKNLKFKILHESLPDYKYLIGGFRVSKSRLRKSEIKRKFKCDFNVSESKFLNDLKIHKIYDCGKIKFEYSCNTEECVSVF